MKLSQKIVLTNVILVLISIAILSAFTLYSTKTDIKQRATIDLTARLKTLHELLIQKGADVHVTDNKLMAGSYVINDNFELPDKIKDLFGGTATVFMGDVRVSTNVIKPDGSRATGTKLQGPAFDAVIKGGNPYRGEALILNEPFFTAYDPIKNSAGEVIGVLYVGAKQSEYLAGYAHFKYIFTALAVGLSIVISFVLFLLVRNALKPLSVIAESVRRLAEKDLTVSFDIERRDEIGMLAQGMTSMLQTLKGVLRRMSDASDDVMVMASGLNNSAVEISESSEAVAAQATTVATAGEEMSATSHDIASNCNMVANSAKRATELTEQGFSVVQQTVHGIRERGEQTTVNAEAVTRLGVRSEQIGEIVSTIEDIADQTNLLALNAAIEAARAGEQGRGFAVVADEVRALAERTTRATREISEMIKAIQSETGKAITSMNEGVRATTQGAEEAAHLEDSLREVLEQVNSVTMQISQIATAAEEQTATTSEISGNIMRITDAAQQSSCKAQETAEEVSKLNRLAEQLLTIQSEFKQEEDVADCIAKAKTAHIVFVSKVKSHVAGGDRLNSNTLPNNQTCMFGKWFHSKGKAACGHTGAFREIDQPHAKVHELGKQAIIAHDKGDRESALRHCHEMAAQSETLMALLDQLLHECGLGR